MKIFITGTESFVGRELIRHCEETSIELTGCDIKEQSDKRFQQADIRSKSIIEIIPGNVDAIVHLAALSSESQCRDKGYDCFDINVMGTLNLMKAAQDKGARQFIFASTEWVYDSFGENETKDEASIINLEKLTSEYALSKIVSEQNLKQKYKHGFCSVTILRFGIIYGARKSNWSAVEALFHSVRDSEEVIVGALKTGRCFIHVSDIASGIIGSIGLDGLETVNLEGDKLITLGEIIETSGRLLNRNPSVMEKDPSNPNVRNVSNRKAKKLLNWEPLIDLDAGIRTLMGFVE